MSTFITYIDLLFLFLVLCLVLVSEWYWPCKLSWEVPPSLLFFGSACEELVLILLSMFDRIHQVAIWPALVFVVSLLITNSIRFSICFLVSFSTLHLWICLFHLGYLIQQSTWVNTHFTSTVYKNCSYKATSLCPLLPYIHYIFIHYKFIHIF